MLQFTKGCRTVVGAAVASAMHKHSAPKHDGTIPAHHTVHPRGVPALLPTETRRLSSASVAQLKGFMRFYETLTRSKEVSCLSPTPLGYGGSERILNNEFLHKCPWQASCVELRERTPEAEKNVLANSSIDFSSLREQSRRSGVAASRRTKHFTSSPCGSYSNVEDMFAHSNRESEQTQPQGPALEVVHYYETSTPEGLAGYQGIAVQVRKQQLPGVCTNFSAEGGFAVWVVPLDEYIVLMSEMGGLPE